MWTREEVDDRPYKVILRLKGQAMPVENLRVYKLSLLTYQQLSEVTQIVVAVMNAVEIVPPTRI